MGDRGLPIPVRKALREPRPEGCEDEGWRRYRARTENPARRPRALPAVAAAAVVVAAALALWLWPGGAGPLRRADGSVVAGSLSGPATVRFEDGSSLALERHARIRVLKNEATGIMLGLERGTITVEVEPGGPRTWVFDCEVATVEVVGTRFTLERTRASLSVRVERGVVLVRSATETSESRRLEAGESMTVRAEQESASRPTISGATAAGESQADDPLAADEVQPSGREDPPEGSEERPPVGIHEAPAREAAWRSAATDGRYDEAWESLGEGGIERQTRAAGAEDLLLLADIARLSGHPAEAAPPLQRFLSGHRSNANAAVAAFTLGRVQADHLRRPVQAVEAFELALELDAPRALRREILARLVDAHRAAGQAARAREVAESYLAEYPDGARAQSMREWFGEGR